MTVSPLAQTLLAEAASLRRLAESLLSPGDAEDVVQAEQAVRTGEIWLEPGEYTMTSRAKDREGTARVVIGREEGPLVRITLR